MDLSFHTLDVFTDHTFGGNPLGVFPDAAHLPTEVMQKVAREMNLSESVFLGPAETPEGAARVRIFTPGVEVPFAGHPTVGTAIYLAASDPAPITDGTRTFVLEENVGPVPVDVRYEDGRPVFARFTTAVLPERRPTPLSSDELARMVGLAPDEVAVEGLVPEMVSCGLPYHVIPVRTLEAIQRAVLDLAAWRDRMEPLWAHHVYLVCPETENPEVDLHVRMFAPGAGVPEDPATGSAAAALGGYLAAAEGGDGSFSWTVEQGSEIDRPSRLQVEAERAGGGTTAVRVGGSAVGVSTGTMTIPD